MSYNSATAASSKRVALVIGNSNYRSMPSVPNARKDAGAIARLLRRLGFTTVKLLSDLTRRRLYQAVKDFARYAAGAEVAVIYYAGHGLELDWHQYILPVDTDWDSPDWNSNAIQIDTLLESLQGASLMRMIILDCCRDHPIPSAPACERPTRQRARVDGSTMIAYATSHGAAAYDGASRHSPYTAALLRYLPLAGLEVDQLFRRVRRQVIANTNGYQEPFVYGAMCPQQFFFA